MNPARKSITLLSLLLVAIGLSCNAPVSLAQKAYRSVAPASPAYLTSAPSPTVSATPVAFTETAQPTETVPPIVPTFNFTPRPTSTRQPPTPTPIPDEVSVFCKEKKPYNLLFISKDATYTLLGENVETRPNGLQLLSVPNADGTLGPRVWCLDNGFAEDGRKVVACTGISAMSYEISVCDPARPGGCLINKLEIIRCAADCIRFSEKEDCEMNAIACVWDAREYVCLDR